MSEVVDIGRASESIAEMVADWYGNAPLPNARITAEVIAARLARFVVAMPNDIMAKAEAVVDRGYNVGLIEAVSAALMAERAALSTAPAGDGAAGMVLVSPQKLIALRDALTAGDVSEAYHVLYSIACPDFDKYEPWDSLDRLSASTAGGGK